MMSNIEIGQVVEFKSDMLSCPAMGIVEKLYDNSCIVSVKEFHPEDDNKIHELISRIVVRYRDIQVQSSEVAVVA
ncbi:hypothetical protein [Vagococcus xieshaowenii]|nr:hypothetical protein [Vagococcus xieshaowenii]QCA28827.1 hypothetical protein E4Z98_05645 [Vagococcus xieshaowenii]